MHNAEQQRVGRGERARWRRWGPYLSDRQWGTVREDYSADGHPWHHFPHDHARSRAYRWGEDGIAGVSDDQQRLCLALALWNGADLILKERFFGLTNHEGNHGEDVKELYYHLDATPSHSYLKLLYKYPQRPFPYIILKEENERRGKQEPEFEIADTGIFEGDRYFDVEVEYAKAAPDDLLMRITIKNRALADADIHVLPQLWFRNTWSWREDAEKPRLYALNGCVVAEHGALGTYRLYADERPELLFCENETNIRRLYGRSVTGHFKDAFHEYVVDADKTAVNQGQTGTKAAAHYVCTVQAAGEVRVRVRLSAAPLEAPFASFDAIIEERIREADAFYDALQANITSQEERRIQRMALAGMIWTQQFYCYDVAQWLDGDPAQPKPEGDRQRGRNSDWQHLRSADILSMPDTWEFPWFAAWDSAFHCLPLTLVDAECAKEQLITLTRERFVHPNGELPAYEWAFSEANPPVHAWAAWRVFQIDRKQCGGAGDLVFLERVFHKLMLNFTWWVNRQDAEGHNVFQGGFLGLDNIGVFDRNEPPPLEGRVDQADGTSWMAMYSLNLMRIALELAQHNSVYEDIATKFFEHFLYIAEAMGNIGGKGVGLWDEEDAFYYDMLHLPDGRTQHLRIRSMVGLIPLFAAETLEPELLDKVPNFARRMDWFLRYRPDLHDLVAHWEVPGAGRRKLLSLLCRHRTTCLLRRMLDESEFLSAHGVRSLSRYHLQHPYTFSVNGRQIYVRYTPAESDSDLFGGNSNWRGPIWFPVNYLIIESLQKLHHYYGDDFKVECPTGSNNFVTLIEVANELTRRLKRLFMPDDRGQRPIYRHNPLLYTHPDFKDKVLFFECFDGDTGRGVGASHQTGWTGLIANLIQPRKPLRKAR